MVFLVLLMPLLLMVFALLMERLEHRLQTTTMSEQDVEEFLDQAQPDEVNTFIREGWSRALSMFRRRNRRPGSNARSWLFTGSRSATKSPSTSGSGSALRPPAGSPERRTPAQDAHQPKI